MRMIDRFEQIRAARGISVEDLSRATGVDVGKLGSGGINSVELERVMRVLGSTMGSLYNWPDDIIFCPMANYKCPMLNLRQAGDWAELYATFAGDEAEDWLTVNRRYSERAFAMRILGDAMEPRFLQGDIVVIDPEIAPDPEDFVVTAYFGGADARFAQWHPLGVDAAGMEVVELVGVREVPRRHRRNEFVLIGTMVEHRHFRSMR